MHESSNKTRVDPRDFKKLNKMSIKSGSVTSKDVNRFRQSNDARIPFGLVPEKPVMIPVEEHTYGKPNRPRPPLMVLLPTNMVRLRVEPCSSATSIRKKW